MTAAYLGRTGSAHGQSEVLRFAAIMSFFTLLLSERINLTIVAISSQQYIYSVPGVEIGIRDLNSLYGPQINADLFLIHDKKITTTQMMAQYMAELVSAHYYRQKSPESLIAYVCACE